MWIEYFGKTVCFLAKIQEDLDCASRNKKWLQLTKISVLTQYIVKRI